MKAFSFPKPFLFALILLAAIVLTACSPKAARTLTMAYIEGGVTAATGPQSTPAAARQGQKLADGDQITTDPDGLAVLQLDDGTLLVVTGASWLTVKQLDGTEQSPISEFYLNNGSTFTFHQGKLAARASYAIETPLGKASIRGSSMSISYSPRVGSTISCLEGDCEYDALVGKLISRIPITAPEWIDHNDSGISPADSMNSALQHEWEFVIGKLKDAGLADPSLLANACHCSEIGNLMCPGQPEVPHADACATCMCGPAGTAGAATLFCSNGKSTYFAPSCVAAMSCRCQVTTRVCQTTGDLGFTSSLEYPDHPACKGVTCACAGSKGQDFTCSDGSVWPDSVLCETWKCEGGNAVSNTGKTIPAHPGCVALLLGCKCDGTTLKCSGEGGPGYTFPSYPTCSSGPTATPTPIPAPTKKPKDDRPSCSVEPNNPNCRP